MNNWDFLSLATHIINVLSVKRDILNLFTSLNPVEGKKVQTFQLIEVPLKCCAGWDWGLLCTFVIHILTIVADLLAEDRISQLCGAGRGPHFDQTSQP